MDGIDVRKKDTLTDFPAFAGFTYFHVVYCVYFYSVVYRFYQIFKEKNEERLLEDNTGLCCIDGYD